MNSVERIKLALNHKEPDYVPFDLGATPMSTIALTAYEKMRAYLNLPTCPSRVAYLAEQLVLVDEDIAERLETDIRGIKPEPPTGFEIVFRDEGAYTAYTDEWGIGWRMPKEAGFYYDMYEHPLDHATSIGDLRNFKFPDALDANRYKNLQSDALAARERGKAVALNSLSPGILEVYSWVRGYEQFYIDLALNQDIVTYWLDRMVEFKSAYWERALQELGDLVDIVVEADDLGGQMALLFSPETYRKIVKPKHKKLFTFIKEQAPVKIFFHSCGSIRPVIGDLIDAGIDILNPIQYTSADMNLAQLKQEFGADLVFWGGGVDTQRVLGRSSQEEVVETVKRNIQILAPGGGFVFATVHSIQSDVPPENIMAMWGTWKACRGY